MSVDAALSLGWRTVAAADVAIGVYESLGLRRGVSTWQFERAPH